MQTITRTSFTTVKTEGGLLPADLLQRIADGRDLPGLRAEDYHLVAGERLNEAINRAWNRCLGAWLSFDDQRRALAPADTGTTLTRERWLLVLFQELGYGRLQALRGGLATPDGSSYPISHLWADATPIHLVTFRQPLDKRSDQATQVKRSPHSLMQEFLNRSPQYHWGIIANGLQLRLLRDNASLRRAAFVEFDLEAILRGELYAEFSLLWLVCHQSRVEPRGSGEMGSREIGDEEDDSLLPAPQACWLETWSKQAVEQGTRALDALRDGVAEAIQALGRGFLAHPANTELRRRLHAGELSAQDVYQQLRRLVYRLIFLCVAEDRDLLLLPATDAATRRRYQEFYSLRRLRELAATLRGGPHADLYRQLRLLFVLLRQGYPALGLPGLGSTLFSDHATPDLDDLELANRDLLDALRALSYTEQANVRRAVDYRNLDSEELGSVYESLLELHPQVNIAAATFALTAGAGSERKTTGSHYTPTSLVEALLDSALEPVIAARLAAVKRHGSPVTGHQSAVTGHESRVTDDSSRMTRDSSPVTAEQALLSIKVLDYASGSGHMLIGAGRRLARHLARIRTGDDEPTPDALRAALRDVVRHCLYGVDLNATAVELCKVALWMETLEPGKPLGFLDAHIRHGNSLVGVLHLDDLADGIPDAAYAAHSGDDKATATALKKRNKQERERGQASLFTGLPEEDLLRVWRKLLDAPEETADQVAAKALRYADLRQPGGAWSHFQTACHLWSAPFFAAYTGDKRTDSRIPTTRDLREYLAAPHAADPSMVAYAQALAARQHFFHWSLEFPEVYQQGGFDVILSNPPWERIKLQEKEWFASRHPAIANAPNAAARTREIAALVSDDPALHADFMAAKHDAEKASHFLRAGDRYPLCGTGDINTYTVFAELAYQMVRARGRAGVIVPSGIATDDTTKFFFQDIMETGSLASLYDFENRLAIFPGVHRSYKFCLLTLRGQGDESGVTSHKSSVTRDASPAEFVFFALDVADLQDAQRRFTLTAAEIALLNPNTRTCPIFRSQRDAELTKAIYRRVPVLIQEGPPEVNPWGVKFATMFHMSNDSHLFRTRAQLEAAGYRLAGNRFVKGDESRGTSHESRVTHDASRVTSHESSVTGRADVYLPLYEAKMFHHFDHRWATYDGLETRDVTLEEKRAPGFSVLPRYWVRQVDVQQQIGQGQRDWIIAFRSITNTTNERSAIFSILTKVAVGNSAPLLLIDGTDSSVPMLPASLSSLAFDYIVRASIGGTNFNFFIVKQLPVLPPAVYARPCPWAGAKSPVTSHESPVTSHESRVTHDASLVTGDASLVTGDASLAAWLLPRVLELTYTAWDLEPFARDVLREMSRVTGHESRVTDDSSRVTDDSSRVTDDSSRVTGHESRVTDDSSRVTGHESRVTDDSSRVTPPPFRWDEARRFLLRCELDAAYFHLYGIERDDVAYILETFPIVKRKDLAAYGEFRTQRVILEIYDAMAEAMRTGVAYATRLDPPPADPRVAHPPRAV